MLKMGGISLVQNQEKSFWSNPFLVERKDGGQRPAINLKQLNKHIPFQLIKIKGLHYLKFMLQQGELLCELDLNAAYFSVLLHMKDSRKMMRFQWSSNLFDFFSMCFALGPAARIFKKLLKVSLSIVTKLNLMIIIYLDGMLLLGKTFQEVLMTKCTMIFLLQHLDFVINFKKTLIIPTQKTDFLGLMIVSM